MYAELQARLVTGHVTDDRWDGVLPATPLTIGLGEDGTVVVRLLDQAGARVSLNLGGGDVLQMISYYGSLIQKSWLATAVTGDQGAYSITIPANDTLRLPEARLTYRLWATSSGKLSAVTRPASLLVDALGPRGG